MHTNFTLGILQFLKSKGRYLVPSNIMLVLGFLIPCLLSSVCFCLFPKKVVANSKANATLAITHIQFFTHDSVLDLYLI